MSGKPTAQSYGTKSNTSFYSVSYDRLRDERALCVATHSFVEESIKYQMTTSLVWNEFGHKCDVFIQQQNNRYFKISSLQQR